MTGRLPEPADFAPAPSDGQRVAWSEADRAARPERLARVRARFADAGVDAYFGVRTEHMRYLTGFSLGDGEEKVAGTSGQFLVGGDELLVLADPRYTIQAHREAPDARVVDVYHDLAARWPELVASIGVRRVAMEAGFVPHATWERLAAAAPEIQPGVTEAALALRLEWLIRTSGAEALAFDVACLSGPEAALPHGAPGDRPVLAGAVLLFDFGSQVAGYRSDMTRTLFVGEPAARDLAIYEVVARAQASAIGALEIAVAGGAGRDGGEPLPSGRAVDAVARAVIEAAGHGAHFGHGTGHGIGLATHEGPSLGTTAPETPLPSPTVFSVEPGIYLEGETGVRIEDLVALDAAAGHVRRLTQFPREVLVVGG